jgi:hypothetical protein
MPPETAPEVDPRDPTPLYRQLADLIAADIALASLPYISSCRRSRISCNSMASVAALCARRSGCCAREAWCTRSTRAERSSPSNRNGNARAPGRGRVRDAEKTPDVCEVAVQPLLLLDQADE